MKKGILIILIIILISTPVFAEVFTDVPVTSWFYKDVMNLQELGIITGYPDGTFRPQNNITKAEALKLILEVADIKINPYYSGSHWAEGIKMTANEVGIINSGSFELDVPVIREEIAEMLVKALKLSDRNVSANYFNDTNSKAVHILKSIGVINGEVKVDGVYYNPSSEITRAELSAIIVRTKKYKISTPIVEPIKEGYRPIDKNVVIPRDPKTKEEIAEVFHYMGVNNLSIFEVTYTDFNFKDLTSQEFVNEISDGFKAAFTKYPEYLSFTNELKMEFLNSGSGNRARFMLLNGDFTEITVQNMRTTFYTEVEKQVRKLINDGKITDKMTDREKAKVLFEWITQNTKYDESFSPASFTGYGQIVNGKAVCQGYTATYNLMCKMVGIEVFGISGKAGGGEHIWTIANLDGEILHIDATFGDPTPDRIGYTNYDYFAADSNFMRKTHDWDGIK